jgi:hypothetical protein
MEADLAVLVERLAGRDTEVGRLERKVSNLETSWESTEADLRAEVQRRAACFTPERQVANSTLLGQHCVPRLSRMPRRTFRTEGS